MATPDSTESAFPIQLQLEFPADDPPRSPIVVLPTAYAHGVDTLWLHYFDRAAALESVSAHIAKLPGDRTTEKLTRRSYLASIRLFVIYAGDRLPAYDLLDNYVSGMKDRGLSSSTVSKHLVAIRHYISALVRQRIVGLTGDLHAYIDDCKEDLRGALMVKSPPPDVTTNESPLYSDKFVRLSLEQVRVVLAAIHQGKLSGLRDYTFLQVALTTGLRLAELTRISLSGITPTGDPEIFLLTVRGKFNNLDPVPLSAECRTLILQWVEAYNGMLHVGDARRIDAFTPVWQPLSRTGNPLIAGRNHYDPLIGMSHQAIRDMVESRTSILGAAFTCSVHDLRRTVAALCDQYGMDIKDISALLRHKNIATTDKYIGKRRDRKKQMITSIVSFAPDAPAIAA